MTTDPYYIRRVLGLNFDGGSAVDTSRTGKTVNLLGGASLSGGQLHLDGTGDRVEVANHTELNFGGSDFTIEVRVTFKGYPVNESGNFIFGLVSKDAPGAREYELRVSGTASSLTDLQFFGFYTNATLMNVFVPHTFALNTEYHIEVSRVGGLVYVFVDGVLKNSGGTAITAPLNATTTVVNVGSVNYDASIKFDLNGSINGVYMWRGVGKHAANFTPTVGSYEDHVPDPIPDSEYSNRVLGLHFEGANASTSFVDNSPTQKTLSSVGNPQLTTAYSQYGESSALFTGGSDVLSTPNNGEFDLTATGFTAQAWVRPTAYPASNYSTVLGTIRLSALPFRGWRLLVSSINGAFLEYVNSAGNATYVGFGSAAIPLGVWTHVAVTYDGTTYRLFVNGAMLASSVDTPPIAGSAPFLRVGSSDLNDNPFIGNIDEVYVHSVALHTASFTPPVGPYSDLPVSIPDPDYANRVLGLHFNGPDGSTDIVDNSPVPKTVTALGDAAIAENPIAFGGSTGNQFGTIGGFFQVADHNELDLGGSSWRITLRVIPFVENVILLAKTANISSIGSYEIRIDPAGILKVYLSSNGTSWDIASGVGGVAMPIDVDWNHVELSYDQDYYRLYVNGVISWALQTSAQVVANTAPLSIGAYNDGLVPLDGLIDEVYIWKGVAGNTAASFTPPVAPYEDGAGLTAILGATTARVTGNFQVNLPAVVSSQIAVTTARATGNIQVDIPDIKVAQLVVTTARAVGNIQANMPLGGVLTATTRRAVANFAVQHTTPGGDKYTLALPTLLEVTATDPEIYSLSMPLALQVYETLSFAVPFTLTVGPPTYKLSLPTALSVYQTYQLEIKTKLSVYPPYTGPTGGQGIGKIVELPPGQSQLWKLEVMLKGVDVSARLIQTASVDAERNSAIVAVFRLRPEEGYVNPYQWVHAPVTITYMETDASGAATYAVVLFQGFVDTPVYDASSRVVEFTCTDDLQNITTRLGRVEVDKLTPKSLWSKYAYEEQVNSWDYMQQRLETYPYSIGLDVNRNYVVDEWGTGAISLEFTESSIIDESLSVSFANTRDITNTVYVSLDYQYTQYRETVLQFDWRDDHWYRGKPLSWLFCSAQMICDAIAGSGGAFIKPPKFNMLPKSQPKHILPDSGQAYTTRFLNTGQDLLVAEFSGVIAKRYGQSITNKVQVTVSNPKGVKALGVLSDTLESGLQAEYNPLYEEAFAKTIEETKWYCTAGSGLAEGRDTAANHYTDPLLFVGAGWIPYPKMSATYTRYSQVDHLGTSFEGKNHTVTVPASPGQFQVTYDINNSPKVGLSSDPGEHLYDFDSFLIRGNRADKDNLVGVLRAQARVRILESHRQNRVAFRTYIYPHIKRGQTVRVATQVMYATGPVYQYLHEFDFDRGEALSSITLALSSSQGAGAPNAAVEVYRLRLPTSLTVTNNPNAVPGAPLIIDVGTLQYGNDYPCHYHDGTINPGWLGHITPANQFRVPQPNLYAMEFPTLPLANTENATQVTGLGNEDVAVPEDELLLYA